MACEDIVDGVAEELTELDRAWLELREDPAQAELVRDTYLDADVVGAASRFLRSSEFAEALAMVRGFGCGRRVLDLGSGNGIASFAFARAGSEEVWSLEPSPSVVVGRGAQRPLVELAGFHQLEGFGEAIPLERGSVDLVYARQVLHHATDLPAMLKECARVLASGGVFLACREHVVDDEAGLQEFLAQHPLHRRVGGENAFTLEQYLGAIRGAGLSVERVLGPLDSVVNAFPALATRRELEAFPRELLRRKLGLVGQLVGRLSPVRWSVQRLLAARRTPGRLYTFLARKATA